jgi:hypothetical protein
MGSSTEYRQFVLKFGSAIGGDGRRKLPWRESAVTLTLGFLSTAVFGATAFELANAAAKSSISSVYTDKLSEILVVSAIGQALGMAGVLHGRLRRRATSPLSTLGTLLNALLMLPLYLLVFVLGVVVVLPLGLLVWGFTLIVLASGKPPKNERELTRSRAQAQVALAAGRRLTLGDDRLRQTDPKRSEAS